MCGAARMGSHRATLTLPGLNWVLNFMHWPRGTINRVRLSACRQFDRLEAELSHGNEGLEDERTAETSRKESKAKLGHKPGHLGLVSAHASTVLRYRFCF